MIFLAILAAWRERFPQGNNIARMMSFPLAKAQRTQRFLWNDPLSDLGGLARKIPASSYYSLAKAQRTLRFLWNDPLSDLGGLARKIPASSWNDPLSDLGGLARKIPASSYYSLAKAQRTLRFLWNNSFAPFAAWRDNYIARKRILACCLFSRKGAKNAKIPSE